MKIETTILLEHSIDDSEIAGFKSEVLQYIKEHIDEDCQVTLDGISTNEIEEFLSEKLPDIVEEIHKGYCLDSGIEVNDYFSTIYFDYYGEDARDLVAEMAQRIYDK
jgi:hypothetical protein